MEMNRELSEIIGMFAFPGTFVEAIPYGNGHINDTYRLTFEQNGRPVYYILQRMNHKVFQKPEELMENIEGVTAWLKKKIQENGGDIYRETLNVIPSADGKAWCVDDTGEYWRAYYFIENALCLDQAAGAQDFYESAVAFGHFQRLLSDYPADTLHETIPDFHNTPDRFRKFRAAVEADVCGRAAAVQDEIRFVMEREAFTHTLMDRLAEGKLPLRVTHNDTKLNNIMLDGKTRKGICVIDLDTVMPGLSVNDFGDSIRFGASTGAEDEPDLTKISCDLSLFEAYTKGFIEGCAGALTEEELNQLVNGAKMMTLECGIRFLTDYLEGDHYFKIHRDGQNLDRCRTQFKLVADMEHKEMEMQEIVNKYR